MAGHSKWANIKHRKGAQDAKRGKVFGKIIREITVAARLGGGDQETNPRLRTVLIKAKSNNMPNDTIDRAIARGTGSDDSVQYEEKVFEAYGPEGVAFVIETLTDNINRTVSEVRHAINKHGGNLGTDGSVLWMFRRQGVISLSAEGIEEEELMETALEAGASDIEQDGAYFVVFTDPGAFSDVNDALEQQYTLEESDVKLIPENHIRLTSDEAIEKVFTFRDALEDLDDVQAVHGNFDLP
ncbi:YebC/PmpR family DNA-binding transcriptional regulator [Chitinivibrio alkaliphilus]|uniref:Probable transcriptional regulatory protein CALK_0578 n=1 Tax=Chitinivibrio alkaliphilus ACht1 TaxID=1313304 RepID=U7DB80_9BACT|nr:YebC/PmpR family DNA-binding transcriptional regulator [Chitinivibrio alkaliphilus]ERP38808.1 transcriptional regulator [Chitinivibrio alkaliphilus ACht1]